MTDMDPDTDAMPLHPRNGAPLNRRKPILDLTINLGHIVTLVTMVGVGMTAWNSMTNRQERIEQRQAYTEEKMREQENRNKETLLEIKSDVKTVQRTIDDLKLTGVPGVRR